MLCALCDPYFFNKIWSPSSQRITKDTTVATNGESVSKKFKLLLNKVLFNFLNFYFLFIG